MRAPETETPGQEGEAEPVSTGGDPKSPFEAAPRDLPTPGRGCSRMALGGCGLLTLVVALGVIALMLYAPEVVSWSLGKIRVEIEDAFPDDLAPSERDRFTRAFDAVLEKIQQGDIDPIALQELQSELMRFAGRTAKASREDVLALIEALERYAAPANEPEAHPPEIDPAEPEGVTT